MAHRSDDGRGDLSGTDCSESAGFCDEHASLRESEERYRAVMQALPLGLHTYDLDAADQLVFSGYNEAADRILGVDHAQFLGQTIEEAFPPLRGTEVPDRYRRAALLAEAWQNEQLDYADGVIRGAFEIRAFQTKARAMAVVFRDVTEQRRLEEELQKAHERLEQRVRQRTAELEGANRELQEMTMQLVHSAKLAALGELTAGVAHELNQPLNAVKITCQGLLRDAGQEPPQPSAVAAKLDKVVGLIDKMAATIRHMRIFTRPSFHEDRHVVDLLDVIEGAFGLTEQQLKINDVVVVRELCAPPLQVRADPSSLEQVLLNLFSNARWALMKQPSSKRRLVVRARAEGESAVVSILDTGVGIAEDDSDRIFEPFFTTKEPGEGTGLGLSVSSKIVEEHRGTLNFLSGRAEGTCFEIRLPLESEDDEG